MNVNAITITESKGKALTALNDRYGYLVKDFVNKDTAITIMELCNDRDNSEIAAIKMAYRIAIMPDSDAIAEGYKNVTQMIEKLVGIKKAMVSNYRTVGKLFLDTDRRSFKYHDYLHGFTVTQLAEGCSKRGTEGLIEDIKAGLITPDMSAKKIREFYKEDDNTVDGEIVAESEAPEAPETPEAPEAPEAAKKPQLYLCDNNNNPAGLVTGVNGYDTEGLVALIHDGEFHFEIIEK